MATTALLDQALQPLAPWRGRRVAVAMSGGVDSSLSAVLLHMAGADVIGMRMSLWRQGDGDDGGLPAHTRDAAAVAERFRFDFRVVDLEADFRRVVIEPFIAAYLAGRTPNPCVVCNKRLKLGRLLEEAAARGAGTLATGHYARLADNPATGRRELRVAADAAKDQTYYLSGLAQDQLRAMLTPLSELTKPQTRELARRLGLPVADKPDSQEICFVADNDYRRFLRDQAALDPAALAGPIVSTDGRTLGRHDGIHNYTIGQRRGLGIAASRPLYVVDLEPATRTVVVGGEEELLATGLTMDGINWVGRAPSAEPLRALVKIRYRAAGQPATVYPEGETLESARVEFDAPVRTVTPGQAAVAYDEPTGQSVLLGGWIRGRMV